MEWSPVIAFLIGAGFVLYASWIMSGLFNWQEGICFAIGIILMLYVAPELLQVYTLPNSGFGKAMTDIISGMYQARILITFGMGLWFFYLAWIAHRDDYHVDTMFWMHRNRAAAAPAAPVAPAPAGTAPAGPPVAVVPVPVPALPSDHQKGAFRFLIIMGIVFLFLSGVHYYLLFNPLLRQLQAVSAGVPIEVRLNAGEPAIVIQFPLSLSEPEKDDWKARVKEKMDKLGVTIEELEIMYVAAILEDGWRINSFAVGFRGNKKAEGDIPAEQVESRLDFENNMTREATDAWLHQLINVHRPLVRQITPQPAANPQQNAPGSSFLPPTPSPLKRL